MKGDSAEGVVGPGILNAEAPESAVDAGDEYGSFSTDSADWWLGSSLARLLGGRETSDGPSCGDFGLPAIATVALLLELSAGGTSGSNVRPAVEVVAGS